MDHVEHIDEFESIFRRAERAPFMFAEVSIGSVMLVIDGDPAEAALLRDAMIGFLPDLPPPQAWDLVTNGDYANVADLLQKIEVQQTDLVVTRRHLHESSLVPLHSLGVYLDELTQRTSMPVLVLPGTAAAPVPLPSEACRRVMVVTDNISGDSRLINHGVAICPADGTMWLCHIEDDAVFARYADAIGQIPEIETEQAVELLGTQLLKESTDFIDTCIAVLTEHGVGVTLDRHVDRGHHLREYRALVDEHDIGLLVANTKDEGQLAMHGMAYALSVELVDVPLLLL